MNFRATTFWHAHNKNLDLAEGWQCASPQLVSNVWNSGENQSAKLWTESQQKLVKTVFTERFATVQV